MPLRLGSLTPAALRVGASEVTAAYLGSTLVYSSAPEFWEPSQLAELAFWLDADDASTITLNGSTVIQWDDKSGNARHVIQVTATSQPTNPIDLNNKRVIQFDGNNDFFNAPEFTTSRTVFIVANKGSATAPQLSGAAPGSFLPTWNVNAEKLEYRSVSTQTVLAVLGGGLTTEYAFGCVQLDTPNNEVKLNIFGGAVTTVSQPLSSSSDSKINIVGRDFAGANQFTDGAVAEIITLSDLISTEDRQNVEGYLAWKWGSV
jgi:hypothetical protein